LKGSRKFQNLRRDNVQQIRQIQESGLWVLGGFIVGFDSDREDIFDRQLEFINQTAITWAMAGVLQAPPTTALFHRLKEEGRLIEDSHATSNFSPPNFRTVLPLPVLLHGLRDLLRALYEPKPFFLRAFRSLQVWQPRPTQKPPQMSWAYALRVWLCSMWLQGIRSNYRRQYWRFLWLITRNWAFEPAKMWLGFMMLLSAHHFVNYARQVGRDLDEECLSIENSALASSSDHSTSSVALRTA
jgi:hypothetical protein